jgi:nucleoid-associated protein YgaU
VEGNKTLNHIALGFVALAGGIGAYALGTQSAAQATSNSLAEKAQPASSATIVDAQTSTEQLEGTEKSLREQAKETVVATAVEADKLAEMQTAAEKAKTEAQLTDIQQAMQSQLPVANEMGVKLASLTSKGLVEVKNQADSDYIQELKKLTDTKQAEVKPEQTDRFNKVNVASTNLQAGQLDISAQLDAAVKRVMALQAKIDALEAKVAEKPTSHEEVQAVVGNSYQAQLNQEVKVRENEMRTIVVKKGDSLWNIAKRAYGNGELYTKICQNPDLIEIGHKLRVPL